MGTPRTCWSDNIQKDAKDLLGDTNWQLKANTAGGQGPVVGCSTSGEDINNVICKVCTVYTFSHFSPISVIGSILGSI